MGKRINYDNLCYYAIRKIFIMETYVVNISTKAIVVKTVKTETKLSKYLSFFLENYSKHFKSVYEYNNWAYPTFNDTDIEKICNQVEQSNWLIYKAVWRIMPNPLTIIDIAKEIGITINPEAISNEILHFLKVHSVTAKSRIHVSKMHDFSEIHGYNLIGSDFVNPIVDQYPNIRRIWTGDINIAVIISTEPFSKEVDLILYEISSSSHFFHHRRPYNPKEKKSRESIDRWFSYLMREYST